MNKDLLRSRSKNSPFDESKMQGRVLRTLVAGKTVYQYPAPSAPDPIAREIGSPRRPVRPVRCLADRE